MLLALTGCLPELPEEKANEGNAAGDCTDRADNDDDGAFDCDDDGCAASPDCAVAPAAPEGLAVAVTPEQPQDGDDLQCAVTTEAVDPNGDAVTYTYAWSVDGADAWLAGESVGNAITVPGQAWTCTVTPSDGTLTGTPASATVTIQRTNAAPSAPVVAITPEAPNDDEGLTCTVVTESVDPDGDTVTYAYAWTVDGVDAGLDVANVEAVRTAAGETWTCSVTASDGTATSGAGTDSVAIAAAASCTGVALDGVDDVLVMSGGVPGSLTAMNLSKLVGAWVKFSEIGAEYSGIVGLGTDAGGCGEPSCGGGRLDLGIAEGGKLLVGTSQGGAVSSASISAGVWYYVFGGYDTARGGYFAGYTDGVSLTVEAFGVVNTISRNWLTSGETVTFGAIVGGREPMAGLLGRVDLMTPAPSDDDIVEVALSSRSDAISFAFEEGTGGVTYAEDGRASAYLQNGATWWSGAGCPF